MTLKPEIIRNRWNGLTKDGQLVTVDYPLLRDETDRIRIFSA